MNRKVNDLVVGAVVLVAFGVLMFGVYFLKDATPGQKLDTYYVSFSQVSTLTVGDPVKINGVKMGTVHDIELHENRVRVTLRVQRGVRIPVDSKVRVQNIGLMGERQIGVILGNADEYYAAGALLPGQFDAGIAEAMGIAGEVFIEAESLVRTVKNVLDSTLGKPEFVDSFNTLLSDTKQLSSRLNKLVDDLAPKVESSVENLEVASREVGALVKEQREPVAEIIQNGRQVSQTLQGVALKVDEMATEVNGILAAMNSEQSTLGALIHDQTFYRQLRSTLDNADTLFLQIREQGLDVNIDIF